jgi:hypothetical protein
MIYRETEHLRVLIANERKDRLALVAPIVAGLGHEVIAREVEVDDVGPVTARERPDVALVGLGESSQHALTLIEETSPGTGRARWTSFCAASPSTTTSRAPRGPGDHRSGQRASSWNVTRWTRPLP